MPVNFVSFLRDSMNKEELFTLFSEAVATCDYQEGKEVNITAGQRVFVRGSGTEMQVTNHEEADTRICLHVQDALRKGAASVIVSTVDTYIVVILLDVFTVLTAITSSFKLWVEFGKGKTLR